MQDNNKNLKADHVGFVQGKNLYFFLILVFIICACAPTPDPVVKGRYYIDPENEFSFKIPKGWIASNEVPRSIFDSSSVYNISKIKDVFINGKRGMIIVSTDRTLMETDDYYKKLLFLSFYDSLKYKYLNAKISGSPNNSVYEFFYDKSYEFEVDQAKPTLKDPGYEIIIDVDYEPIDIKNCKDFCNVLNVKSSTYKRLKHKGLWAAGRAAYVNAPNTPPVNDLALKGVQQVFFSNCGDDDTCITSITLSSDESTFVQNMTDYKNIIGSLSFGSGALIHYNQYR